MLVKRIGPVGAFIQLRLTLPHGSTNTHGDCAELHQHLSVLGITKDGTVPTRVGWFKQLPTLLRSCAAAGNSSPTRTHI